MGDAIYICFAVSVYKWTLAKPSTQKKAKNGEETKVTKEMMSGDVEERQKKNEMHSDNVQAILLSVDISQDSALSSDLEQQKNSRKHLSDKDSDTKYKEQIHQTQQWFETY